MKYASRCIVLFLFTFYTSPKVFKLVMYLAGRLIHFVFWSLFMSCLKQETSKETSARDDKKQHNKWKWILTPYSSTLHAYLLYTIVHSVHWMTQTNFKLITSLIPLNLAPSLDSAYFFMLRINSLIIGEGIRFATL